MGNLILRHAGGASGANSGGAVRHTGKDWRWMSNLIKATWVIVVESKWVEYVAADIEVNQC